MRLCVLPGVDTSSHPWEGKTKNVWMGLPPDHANAGKTSDWAAPCERINEQGCPGGWSLSRFRKSLQRFYRPRTEDGGRVENRELSMCEDPLVIEAINYLEAEEEAAHAEYMRCFYADQAAKAKRRANQ